MTMNINGPGGPENDETARRQAWTTIRDMLDGAAGVNARAGRSGAVADHLTRHHVATWERDVDSAGRAVRRYVLRGEWELEQPEQAANPVEAALRSTYERISLMVTTDHEAINDCLDAVRAVAKTRGVTL